MCARVCVRARAPHAVSHELINGRRFLVLNLKTDRPLVVYWAFIDAAQAPRYMTLVDAKAAVDGPTVSMVQQYRLGEHTTLTQQVLLVAGSRRLDFRTQAHWREPQAMLRTSFPVAVQSETAAFEIQMGTIHRPTHTNTTWDLAKSEVPAQKWADLSQRDYGVALLNDCKCLLRPIVLLTAQLSRFLY
eukprot:COSAG03_NODE_301_length_9204_cov_86.896870_6_plen_188_part_00